MEHDSSKTDNAEAAYKRIFPTCAAMLWHDWRLILCLYPLLVITSVIAVDLPGAAPEQYLLVALGDRLLELLFSYLVVVRWIRRLSQGPRPISATAMLRFFIFGLSIWILFSLPLSLGLMMQSSGAAAVSIAMAGVAAWVALRFYFYPVPVLLGRGTMAESLQHATAIRGDDPLLPLRLLVAPCGLLSLVTAVTMSFSPDGRELWASYATAGVGGVFWVVATYLSLAAALLRLDERIWREENLDPYRAARLSTLEFQGPRLLARQLRPAQGFGWFLVSLLVWGGTLLRLFSTPPAATITVKEVRIQGPTVTLQLHLSDERYRFRGLQPIYFALAGDQRAVIAANPSSATIPGSEQNVILGIPEQSPEVDLTLTFSASRSGADLKALKDLHLWYRTVKITPLNMEQAVLE